jgi:hypothetical protein
MWGRGARARRLALTVAAHHVIRETTPIYRLVESPPVKAAEVGAVRRLRLREVSSP